MCTTRKSAPFATSGKASFSMVGFFLPVAAGNSARNGSAPVAITGSFPIPAQPSGEVPSTLRPGEGAKRVSRSVVRLVIPPTRRGGGGRSLQGPAYRSNETRKGSASVATRTRASGRVESTRRDSPREGARNAIAPTAASVGRCFAKAANRSAFDAIPCVILQARGGIPPRLRHRRPAPGVPFPNAFLAIPSTRNPAVRQKGGRRFAPAAIRR